jgi:thiamine-phosphate pyrophosphorylase
MGDGMSGDSGENEALEDDDNALDPNFAERFERDPRRPACQLYLISPSRIDESFAAQLVAVLATGLVAAFQLRLKDLTDDEVIALGAPLRALCAAHDTAFIVNDSIAIAEALEADGVHLGQGDGDPREARRILGPEAQIGVTCHDSRHLAMEAGEAGADYVAFGAFYPTTTKEVSHHADLALLGWWSTIFELPCVAIGGITADNAAPLIAAGADFIAVAGAVWNCDDPVAAVRRFGLLLKQR